MATSLPKILLSPWAITKEGLELVVAVASRDEFFADVRKKALESKEGQALKNTHNVTQKGNVAVIPIQGPLMRHASLMSDISGATSYEQLKSDLASCLKDPQIESIVFDCDSPGGEVHGCGELSAIIYESKKIKPIYTYVSGMCCSAAYWLCSATDSITADPSAIVGSIGVRTMLVDDSKRDEMAGVKEYEIVSSQSPYKVVDASDSTDRARVKAQMTDLAAVFVGDVARNRDVSVKKVLTQFGQGDVFVGALAEAAGLIDDVDDLDTLVATLHANKKGIQGMSKPIASMKTGMCDACKSDMDDDDKMYCDACYKSDADATALLGELYALSGEKNAAKAAGFLAGLKAKADLSDALSAELAGIKAEQTKADIKRLLDEAVIDGRIAPAKKSDMESMASKFGLEALQSFLSVIPKAAAPAIAPKVEVVAPIATSGLDAAQLKILSTLGVSLEDFAAQKTKLAKAQSTEGF